MAGKDLRELFHETLKDIYFAEKKILSTLPKMAKAAQSKDLKAAFEKHETQTEEHVNRLEQVFEEFGAAPKGKTCDAIMGIIEEGQEVMKEFKGAPALDAAKDRLQDQRHERGCQEADWRSDNARKPTARDQVSELQRTEQRASAD